MTRQDLLDQLDRYFARHPDEAEMVGRIRDLLKRHERAFYRDCVPGHITSSAWIVSRESRSVLLTHHRKLERWLQLGGHTDGEMDVLASALREAEEESGLQDFSPIPSREAAPPFEILDVDVHLIPARGDEPAHEHHDIRFLLEVSEDQQIEHQVAESKEIRWFPGEGIEAQFDEESLARMARKAKDWLSRSPAGPGSR
ncbi:MAG: NUDIX hydrolase [Myxococcota bacterium]